MDRQFKMSRMQIVRQPIMTTSRAVPVAKTMVLYILFLVPGVFITLFALSALSSARYAHRDGWSFIRVPLCRRAVRYRHRKKSTRRRQLKAPLDHYLNQRRAGSAGVFYPGKWGAGPLRYQGGEIDGSAKSGRQGAVRSGAIPLVRHFVAARRQPGGSQCGGFRIRSYSRWETRRRNTAQRFFRNPVARQCFSSRR